MSDPAVLLGLRESRSSFIHGGRHRDGSSARDALHYACLRQRLKKKAAVHRKKWRPCQKRPHSGLVRAPLPRRFQPGPTEKGGGDCSIVILQKGFGRLGT